jgi:hypothetical protein
MAEKAKFFINTNPEELVKESETVCNEIAFWAEQWGSAEAAIKIEEHRFAAWKSAIKLEVLKMYLDRGDKAPSDSKLEDQYRTRPEYMTYATAIAEAMADARKAEGAYYAAKGKRSLVETLLGKFDLGPNFGNQHKPQRKPL